MADLIPTEAPQRPSLASHDTLDATELSGSLSHDGSASLQADLLPGLGAVSDGSLRPAKTEEPKVPEPETKARDVGSRSKSEPAVLDDSDDTIEDYDSLEVDPDTLVVNSRKSIDASFRPSLGPEVASPMGDEDSKRRQSELEGVGEGMNGKHKKRGSIQIRLEKTDRKGRYILTADDPEIKDILRKGMEREQQEKLDKKPRVRFRDLVFTRQFTTFDRQNPASKDSPFFGFFTLFWIAMVLLFFQVSMRNWREYGSILGQNEIMSMMFSHDVFLLGVTDGMMCAGTFVTFFLQKLVQAGYINWSKGGWVMQNLWQSMYLGGLIGWAYFREWPWTHTIFITLHGLVFLMKQHSYAFYNGYLSGVYRRRRILENKLKQLQNMEPIHSRPNSPTSPDQSYDDILSASGVSLDDLVKRTETNSPMRRRPSMAPRTSTNFSNETSDVASVASAIQSGSAISTDQMQTFEHIILAEIQDLAKELVGKCPHPNHHNTYPNNQRLSNFAEFICLPTLVYELDYPRQERINWSYVLEKTTATFGVLCVMMVISQAFIYPPVAKTVAMKESGMSIEERWRELPFIVSDMLFPLLIEQLLTWYLIWECILNVLAEVTRFADRGFYGDWWNSVTWDQYARDWNRPVHNFLLRHVYHSSISTLKLSRNAATFVTFLLSALVHEMIMAILFKKVRGYLFWMQLLQMPLVMVSRSKMLRDKVILGNVMFWVGLFVGPSFLTSLYLVI